MAKTIQKFDLEERTAKFGEEVIVLCKSVRPDIVNSAIISQLTRSATSIGANYMEANGASSKKDFRNKAHICKKEAQESKHWLRMLAKASSKHRLESQILWQEAHELTLIFNKITSSLKN